MAKAFRFRLETVLKLRQQHEDEHKRIVAARTREVLRARQRSGRLQDQIRSEIQAMRELSGAEVVEAGQLSRHRHWISHLNRQVLETTGEIRTLQGKLAEEQARLREVTKHRKVLDKLKERQHTRYATALAREERLESDEMATMRYAHQRAGW